VLSIKRPSAAMVTSGVALLLALGGSGAYAADQAGLIGSHQIQNGAVTQAKIHTGAVSNQKLHNGSISWGKLNTNVQSRINAKTASGSTPIAGPQGPKGDTGATGATGAKGAAGATGATGAAGAAGQNGTNGTNGMNGTDGTNGSDGGAEPGESIQTATPDLTMDAAPGPNGSQGSAGFGWDSTTNGPVTSVTVGTPAQLSATALALGGGTLPDSGQITFVFDTDYLSVDASSLPSQCSIPSGDQADGIVVCAWSGSHSDQSEGITFNPVGATAETAVTATTTTDGETVTQQVPITVTSGS
jgi:hypothetical protein